MFYRYIMHTMQIFTCVCRGAMVMRVSTAYGHLTSIPGSHRPRNSGWKPEFNLLTRGNLCSHMLIFSAVHCISYGCPFTNLLLNTYFEKLCVFVRDTKMVSAETNEQRNTFSYCHCLTVFKVNYM